MNGWMDEWMDGRLESGFKSCSQQTKMCAILIYNAAQTSKKEMALSPSLSLFSLSLNFFYFSI